MPPGVRSHCDGCVPPDERMRRRPLVRSGRRRFLAGMAGLLLAPWWYRRASAAEVDVPIPLQIELMAKVVKYDRNAATRMKDGCRLLLVRRADDSESSKAAAQARAEL